MDKILNAFGLAPGNFKVETFGSGLINHTWKITGEGQQYILQRINVKVFKKPEDIAANLVRLESYLKQNVSPYLFAAPLPATNGEYLVKDEAEYYRLSPFIKKSHTINFITQSRQAYEAAKQFGKFTRLLKDFDLQQLKQTLPEFHNLNLRVEQFKTALEQADNERSLKAADEISRVKVNLEIAQVYQNIVNGNLIPQRVIHHDTKINNILFDDNDCGLCVIDLDTVMPGYFISDVGDMMRTYLSPANEEEQDLDKVQIIDDYFIAVYKGYMEEMRGVLTDAEKDLFIYSGKFMIFMQAVRFLTDFLNGDIYYGARYPGHNLARAKNQLRLLTLYNESEEKFHRYIDAIEKEFNIQLQN